MNDYFTVGLYSLLVFLSLNWSYIMLTEQMSQVVSAGNTHTDILLKCTLVEGVILIHLFADSFFD